MEPEHCQVSEALQRCDVAHLVIIKVQLRQIRQVSQRRSVAYPVIRELQRCQVGEIGEG